MSTTTPPPPTYGPTQIIYTFARSASAAYGNEFDNLTEMQNYVTSIEIKTLKDQNIQGLIGTDWLQEPAQEPVWGPIVYAKVTTGATVVADNTIGCYFSPSQKMFVIAIAGTNVLSEFDWLSEDLAVSKLVAWTTISPSAPATSGNISQATATGLQTLLAMQDSGGQTLLQALKSCIAANNTTGATVAVCGHSLAGALSPCFALYMVENQSLWEPAGTALPVSVYATAGPTPGDSGFATYYEGVIAAGNITYSSLYNTLDVVPLAWDSNDLETIPFIYDTYIVPATTDSPPDAFMGIAACGLWVDAAAPNNYESDTYTHVSTGRKSDTGTFDITVDDSVSKLQLLELVLPSKLQPYGPYVWALARFVVQAVFQHTTAYWGDPNAKTPVVGLLNIDTFSGEYETILANNPPTNAVKIDVASNAVRKITGVDLGKIEPEALASAAAAAGAKKE